MDALTIDMKVIDLLKTRRWCCSRGSRARTHSVLEGVGSNQSRAIILFQTRRRRAWTLFEVALSNKGHVGHDGGIRLSDIIFLLVVNDRNRT